MGDAEGWAVTAIERLIYLCPHLKGEINKGDRFPITDGYIVLYRDESGRRAQIDGRVPVQVKGVVHGSKKKFSASSITYPIEAEVLRYFRDNGGGIYFCVLIHPENRTERIFAAALFPFKLERLINGMKPGQKTLNVKLNYPGGDPARLEQLVRFAWGTSRQDVRQGFDWTLLRDDSSIEIHSIDGLDLSRPAELKLDEQDFAVVLHTGDLRLYVDLDLKVIPASYVEREVAVDISCGDVTFNRPMVKQIDDDTTQLRLSPALTLEVESRGRHVKSNLNLENDGDFPEHHDSIRFFLNLWRQDEISLGGKSIGSAEPLPAAPPGLKATLGRYDSLAELFSRLHVDPRIIRPTEITEDQMNTLGLVYRAIVRGEELSADAGQAGRFDVWIGVRRIALMAVPGESVGRWSLFDPFDPAMRDRFRLIAIGEDEQPREISGTPYEGVSGPEMGELLNLRLEELADSYKSVSDEPAAKHLSNRKVLHLLEAADATTGSQREALLRAASQLNVWLLEDLPANPVHLVNGWQIAHRQRGLSVEERNDIRSLRYGLARSDESNARHLEACCAILLGDQEDISHAMAILGHEQGTAVRSWPIWNLTTKD